MAIEKDTLGQLMEGSDPQAVFFERRAIRSAEENSGGAGF